MKLLLESDPTWLDSYLQRKERININWEERDAELLEKLINVVKDLYLDPPDNKIAKETILKKLSDSDQILIRIHKDKLPSSIQYLKDNVEITENFLIRKINDTINYYKRQGRKNVTAKLIMSHTRYQGCSEVVKKEILKSTT